MNCEMCGNTTDKRFCSKSCCEKYRYRTKIRKEKVCNICGRTFIGSIRTKNANCRSCLATHLYGKCGSDNNAWRGGHKYWQSGKFGKDKDGLSWKKQRKLAWERDKYTCQVCGVSPITLNDPTYKPDVHHINPYRLSFSHDINNLISLCRSCHKKEEASIVDLWGGEILKPPQHGQQRTKCIGCLSSRRKKNEFGYCSVCYITIVLLPKIISLKESGMCWRKIGKELKIKHQTLWRWYIKYYIERKDSNEERI